MTNPTPPPLIARERWLLGGLLVSLLFSVYLMLPLAGDLDHRFPGVGADQ